VNVKYRKCRVFLVSASPKLLGRFPKMAQMSATYLTPCANFGFSRFEAGVTAHAWSCRCKTLVWHIGWWISFSVQNAKFRNFVPLSSKTNLLSLNISRREYSKFRDQRSKFKLQQPKLFSVFDVVKSRPTCRRCVYASAVSCCRTVCCPGFRSCSCGSLLLAAAFLLIGCAAGASCRQRMSESWRIVSVSPTMYSLHFAVGLPSVVILHTVSMKRFAWD